jgi:hypothetical protein
MSYSRRSFLSLLPPAAFLARGWIAEAQSADGPFSFAVLGADSGRGGGARRFNRVVSELNAQSLAFVVHVGESGAPACSADAYRERRDALDRIQHPVIYTPGDGDWYDCPGRGTGEPSARLRDLRNAFFNPAGKSLGGRSIDLETQAGSTDFREFVENTHYVHGKVVVIAMHLLRADDDGAAGGTSRRRADAAIAWLYATAQAGMRAGVQGAVIALHAGMPDRAGREAYDGVYWALIENAQHAPIPLLVVHGGTDGFVADRPFRDPLTGNPIANLERLRALASPNAGWIKVDVDTTAEQPFRFEAKLASPRSPK